MTTTAIRKRMIPTSSSWAFSEKTRPLYVVGKSNVVGQWAFFDCDHAVQRCVERGTRYEKDDLKVIVSILMEAVFTSSLVELPEFREVFVPSPSMNEQDLGLKRVQIRDCNNDTISAIVEIDAVHREVFLITVIAPKEAGMTVAGKRNYLLNICKTDDEYAKMVFSDNRGSCSRVISSCVIESTAWL